MQSATAICRAGSSLTLFDTNSRRYGPEKKSRTSSEVIEPRSRGHRRVALANSTRDQRHRHSHPHQLRPRAARACRRSNAARRRSPLITPISNTILPAASAGVAALTSSTLSRCSARPRRRPSSTTAPPRSCCILRHFTAQNTNAKWSFRAASWSRSAAGFASPKSSKRAARDCAKSARPTRRRLTITPARLARHRADPQGASQQFLHGRLRRIAGHRRDSRRCARKKRVPFVEDLGSGAIVRHRTSSERANTSRRLAEALQQRRRSGLLQRRQAARRPAGRNHRRQNGVTSPRSSASRFSARCAATNSSWPRCKPRSICISAGTSRRAAGACHAERYRMTNCAPALRLLLARLRDLPLRRSRRRRQGADRRRHVAALGHSVGHARPSAGRNARSTNLPRRLRRCSPAGHRLHRGRPIQTRSAHHFPATGRRMVVERTAHGAALAMSKQFHPRHRRPRRSRQERARASAHRHRSGSPARRKARGITIELGFAAA